MRELICPHDFHGRGGRTDEVTPLSVIGPGEVGFSEKNHSPVYRVGPTPVDGSQDSVGVEITLRRRLAAKA